MKDPGERARSAPSLGRTLLCTTDTEGRLTSVSSAWGDVLGWSQSELIGRPFIEFVHPDDVEASTAAAGPMTEAGGEVIGFENRYRTKDGGWRWLRWNARSNGTTWLATAYDFTAERAEGEHVRTAIADDRLLAYSQPIVDRRSGDVVEEELLVRMTSEDGAEVLSPAAFLPAAERSGEVTSIDRWMTVRGLELAERGRNVSVNLSGHSINDEHLMEELGERIGAIGVAARRVSFEITETVALANPDAARDLAARLGRLGCRIALDDFGTGFGSLSHLRQLPVHSLKIDITFIRGLRTDPTDRTLVRGIGGIARELGLVTVAEGVEDPTTYKLLGDFEIDRAQGFLIGRPAPLEPLPRLQPEGRSRPPGSQANRRRANRASTP